MMRGNLFIHYNNNFDMENFETYWAVFAFGVIACFFCSWEILATKKTNSPRDPLFMIVGFCFLVSGVVLLILFWKSLSANL